ncbi:MAG: glycine zipper domain-containing protein [Pirellulaceae bacterium]
MLTRFLLSTLVVSWILSPLTQAQHTERGAALGGIGGALAGAAIGKHNGETAAGALIGGAVGLLSGAVIGNSLDDKARLQAYERQQLQQQYYVKQQAVSTNDVVTMVHSGVSDDVIMNHIRENGVQRKIEVGDVIALHKSGVSESVITTMQNARVGAAAVAVAPPPPVYQARPVIVEERYYAVPPPVYYYRPYWGPPHHHHYHPRSSHVHWGVTIGR